jgi:hypothetical protein
MDLSVLIGSNLTNTLDTSVLVALIAAIASLLVSILGFITTRSNQRDVERLKADLAERNAIRNARLEYEFEARKRLYQECAPLLFELSEMSERALGRIIGLARTASEGNLEPGPNSWLRRNYYNRSTFYRLIAPLAIGKILRTKLTHVDLSLDPSTHWQYLLCKQLEDTFTDDFDLAKYEPQIQYQPHNRDAAAMRDVSPEMYWQQGIPRGILDNAVSALILEDEDRRRRVMSFAEFESGLDSQEGSVRASFARISYLLEDFHPRTRPVLWRIFLAQAHIYKALLVTRGKRPHLSLWDEIWADGMPDFDWRSLNDRSSFSDESITRAIEIGASYSKEVTRTLISKIDTDEDEKTA